MTDILWYETYSFLTECGVRGAFRQTHVCLNIDTYYDLREMNDVGVISYLFGGKLCNDIFMLLSLVCFISLPANHTN